MHKTKGKYCVRCAQIKCLCKLKIPLHINNSVLTLIVKMIEEVDADVFNETQDAELYIDWSPQLSPTEESVCATVFVDFYDSEHMGFYHTTRLMPLPILKDICNEIGETDPLITFHPNAPQKYEIKLRFNF